MDAEAFLSAARESVVLDVRSPREHAQGHLPGAISFPLFLDEERAVVGKTYKQVGQTEAILSTCSRRLARTSWWGA